MLLLLKVGVRIFCLNISFRAILDNSSTFTLYFRLSSRTRRHILKLIDMVFPIANQQSL